MPIRIGTVVHRSGYYDGHWMSTECFIRVNDYTFTEEEVNCPKCLEIEKKWMDEWREKSLLKETPSVEEIKKYFRTTGVFGWRKGGYNE